VVTGFSIGDRRVGDGAPCYIIAEAGVNHNGELDLALKLVAAAAGAGADAVKFQTFSAERLAADNAPKAAYQECSGASGETQLQMLKRLELDEDEHCRIQESCKDRGIEFLSSPFDEESADFLEELGIQAFKIPSGELTNHRYLSHVAAKGLPLLVSTGMADMMDVAAAVDAIERTGKNTDYGLLHCISAYPAEASDCNLRAMTTLSERFSVPVGWSDHTLGRDVAIAAAALGARMIEKHLTLDCTMTGPDHKASMEPVDFKDLVEGVRRTEEALGSGEKVPREAELEIASVARKSLVFRRDMEKGEALRSGDVMAQRPGSGLPPSALDEYLGRTLNGPVKSGEMLKADMFGEVSS